MTIADEAITNALPCELVKYALRQSKDGIVISFVVHPNDIPAALQTSPIGSRWMAALVQIGDDEKPVQQREEAPPDSRQDQPLADNPDGDRRNWKDVQPSAQAAMRCDQAPFWAFLREEKKQRVATKDDAATAVRKICGVNTRARFNDNHTARVMWHQLDTEFQAWQAKERVGA